MSNDKTRSQTRKKRALAEEKTSLEPTPTPFQMIMIALIGFVSFSTILLGALRLVVHGYHYTPDMLQYDLMLVAGGFVICLLTVLFMPRAK